MVIFDHYVDIYTTLNNNIYESYIFHFYILYLSTDYYSIMKYEIYVKAINVISCY